jgi:hypothetical protein
MHARPSRGMCLCFLRWELSRLAVGRVCGFLFSPKKQMRSAKTETTGRRERQEGGCESKQAAPQEGPPTRAEERVPRSHARIHPTISIHVTTQHVALTLDRRYFPFCLLFACLPFALRPRSCGRPAKAGTPTRHATTYPLLVSASD